MPTAYEYRTAERRMTFSVSSEQRTPYKNAGQAGSSVPFNIPGNISEKLCIKTA